MPLKPTTDSPARRKGQPGPAFTDPECLTMGVQPKSCSAFLPWTAAGRWWGIQFAKGTWKTLPVTRVALCPARLVVPKSPTFEKTKLLGNSRKVGQDPGG